MILTVENLRVSFGAAVPVRDVSFAVPARGKVAIVGESGCGKSLTSLALKNLSPVDRADVSGRIQLNGRLAYVFQSPTESLNPVMRIGAQIQEVERDRAVVLSLLARCGLDAERVARAYPCELSGGQQQRAAIAMALAAKPDLLVADEPTTALDVTTQRDVLDLVDALAAERNMAVLLITHNLGLVAGRMETVNVMYAGEIVEAGPVVEVLAHPRHPYTQGLLAAVPVLDAPRDAPLTDIPGTVPPPDRWPAGCAFAPRCPCARAECHATHPPVRQTNTRRFRCLVPQTAV